MATILLLDSPDGQAAILASALRVEGLDVEHATTTREAEAVLERTPVALAIVDLMMRGESGSNGLDLARELRNRYPQTRVLLTSAYHLSARQLERVDCGVSGFIPKPFDLGEVVQFILAKVGAPPSSRRLWSGDPASGVVDVPGISAIAQRRR